jgi:hypothetical protein
MTSMSTPVARVLPPEEWAEKLADTPLVGYTLNPHCTRVIVVEQAGRVVACIAAMTIVHAEGLWAAEEVRTHPGVARALLQTLAEVLTDEGVPEVLSQSQSAFTDDLFQRVGGIALPGTCFVIPIPATVPAEEIH